MRVFMVVDRIYYDTENITYGVLIVDNDLVTKEQLQTKLDEIQADAEKKEEYDLMVADLVRRLPKEWNTKYWNEDMDEVGYLRL